MKNTSSPNTARFKIKFTPLVIALCIVVFLLCAGGIALSVWRIVRFGVHGFNDILKYPFLIAVCVFCIVLMICILAKSQYVVTDQHFITQFGFIKSKFVVKDVTSIVYNTDTKKVTLYFGEQFMVVSVCPEWQEEFIRALMKVNPEIDYSFTLSDTTTKRKK